MTNFLGTREKGKASLREAREKRKGERGKIYKSFPFSLSPLCEAPFPFLPIPMTNDELKSLIFRALISAIALELPGKKQRK
jgi:hypothetical protein